MHTALYESYERGDTNPPALQNVLTDQEWYLDRRDHQEALQERQHFAPNDMNRLDRYKQQADEAKAEMMREVNGSPAYQMAFYTMYDMEAKYLKAMELADPVMLERMGRYQYRHRIIEKTMKSMQYPKKERPQ